MRLASCSVRTHRRDWDIIDIGHVLAHSGKYRNCTQWNESTSRMSIDNATLSLSRGEVLQPFLSQILQSQMVHQVIIDYDRFVWTVTVCDNLSMQTRLQWILFTGFYTLFIIISRWHDEFWLLNYY